MVPGRTLRAGLPLTIICAAALGCVLWAATGAHASVRCDRACQAARQAKKERSALLRARNALQKRPNVVVIKLGRNLPKVRRALERTGRLARAVYVERGTMTDERAIPLAAKADDCAPYFAIVLVPGWERRP